MGRIQDYPIDGTPENGDILLGTNVLDAKKSKNYSIQSIVGLVPAGPSGASGSQGVQGIAGPPGPVGPAGLEWQGAWDANTSYALNDAVAFSGASWFCINPISTTGNDDPETDTATWALLAAQGAQGPQGVQGNPGATGPQGPAGVSTLPYLSYVALVSQVGTSAPITTFSYNNTGLTATWSRFQAGGYMLTFSGDVVEDQATIWYSNSNNQGGTKNVIEVTAADSIALLNYNSAGTLVDGISYAPIEIRFY